MESFPQPPIWTSMILAGLVLGLGALLAADRITRVRRTVPAVAMSRKMPGRGPRRR